jgi:hypothetical protein
MVRFIFGLKKPSGVARRFWIEWLQAGFSAFQFQVVNHEMNRSRKWAKLSRDPNSDGPKWFGPAQ